MKPLYKVRRFANHRPIMPTNLFADLPQSTATAETFLELLQRPGLRIERIVSTGQCSPPDFWYDQPEGEWVLVLQGEAGLRFADEAAPRTLRAGDFVDIAPHRRHRVDWTAADGPTVWLAIFYAA
ncbi:MAG: cupin domain-containing protein [Azonexaceae bacterium]|nr:cupin domain-containing protein [Azonexaceae bacterium]